VDANELIKTTLPGVIVGCAIYVVGALLGPILGPGWEEIIQGLSFFIGLICVLLLVLHRRQRDADGKNP
jgi:Na+(H+)/acetate symporter ActP